MDTLTLRQAHRPEDGITTLLQAHFDLMRATSPEESCHVMAPDTVFEGGTVVVVAELGGAVVGIGAYRPIDADHAELKSMHTAQAARGKGVGQKILDYLTEHARAAGFARLSLETGTPAPFAPARRLYETNGFVETPPFGAYEVDPYSVFMTRAL